MKAVATWSAVMRRTSGWDVIISPRGTVARIIINSLDEQTTTSAAVNSIVINRLGDNWIYAPAHDNYRVNLAACDQLACEHSPSELSEQAANLDRIENTSLSTCTESFCVLTIPPAVVTYEL